MLRPLPDDDVDALLTGEVPPDFGELAAVAGLVRGIRHRLDRTLPQASAALSNFFAGKQSNVAASGSGRAIYGEGPGSYETFHRQQWPTTLRYARGIVGDQAADDVCQEAWMRIWRAWHTATVENREAWMMTIVRNCSYDALRARRATVALCEQMPIPGPSLEDAAIPRLDQAGTWAQLRALAFPLRQALWLREIVGLSYAEVAEVQDVPIGTVMSRLHSARKKAARRLTHGGGGTTKHVTSVEATRGGRRLSV